MKVLYSQIKELIPDLKAGAKEVGEALTFTGFMMDSFTEVSYKGTNDFLIGLEIRQNRADCLSVIGIAREVAAYYNLDFLAPIVEPVVKEVEQLNIEIEENNYVKRVLAVKIDGIINEESPEWLKQYMTFYGLNSVNLLVDLSNYVMFLTGYPSHLIDFEKVTGRLVWSLNHDFDEINTLFDVNVKLQRNTELIIKDEKNILALAGIVGGRNAAIDIKTSSIIAEIAVYDRSIIRKNSRSLNMVTEASHRLEKDLDPNCAEYAINMLISLISKYAKGKIASNLFDYYPQKCVSDSIEFDANLPGKFAGIEINKDDILRIFKNLDFVVGKKDDLLLVTPPTYRMDISLPEDLVEEVLRIYGYNRIPSNEIPKLEIVPNITPKNIVLAEKMRDILSTLGYDEVLSWPLTKNGDNELVNYIDWNIVSTQNSVNDVYPDLRQSMITGLLNQLNEYNKKNVDFINIFEIGKVFGEKCDEYIQRDTLGIMSVSDKSSIIEFKNKVESLLRLVGLDSINYPEAMSKPKIANSNSCWDVCTGEENIGILYKLVPQETKLNVYFAEVNIEKVAKLLLDIKENPVVEITQKLIALDANVELDIDDSIVDYLNSIRSKLNEEHVWSIVVADTYLLDKKIRYTIRVTYMNLSDQESKEIHLNSFELK